MLLAIDTSGPMCSSALLDRSNDEIVARRSDDLGRGHAEHLMGQLEDLLAEAASCWSDIQQLACITGPGSFTGLRVGLATARGLALARKIPCTGVTVFEAFAWQYAGRKPLVVAMDARRGQIWLQQFDAKGDAAMDPRSVTLDNWPAARPPGEFVLAGSAAPLLAGDFQVLSDAPSPPIEAVLKCAASKPVATVPPSPLYLRSPDAKPQAATRAGAGS